MKKATIRYRCNAVIKGHAVIASGIFEDNSVKA